MILFEIVTCISPWSRRPVACNPPADARPLPHGAGSEGRHVPADQLARPAGADQLVNAPCRSCLAPATSW